MSEAVHDDQSDKLGCRIAIALEEQFIAAGWPIGHPFATEQALCRQFGVSRRIIREALRVLELRGTARLRRGTHPTLEITTPNAEIVVDILRGYAFLNDVTADHRAEALIFLERVKQRLARSSPGPSPCTPMPELEFLETFTRDHLVPGSPPLGVLNDRFQRVRAGRIAMKLIDQFVAHSFEPGRRIGSESEISAQFQADRSITRQAIRLLECSGMVSSLPGRGNGIILHRPTSGPVCRLICCYLAANQMRISKAFELFRGMSVEAVGLVAIKEGLEDIIQRLQQTLATNWQSGRVAQLSDIFSTEDSQFDAIKNPLISLFVRSIRGYVALTVAEGGLAIPNEIASCFADSTRRVFEAIARREPEAAVLAQEAKLQAMRELDHRLNPKVAGILYAL
jgi:DNA-binding FadR family transcriptional regulator